MRPSCNVSGYILMYVKICDHHGENWGEQLTQTHTLLPSAMKFSEDLNVNCVKPSQGYFWSDYTLHRHYHLPVSLGIN